MWPLRVLRAPVPWGGGCPHDVDLPGRIRLGEQTRIVDDLSHAAISRYLTYRQSRWPHTTNPYLLINQQTAHHDRPAGRWWLRKVAQRRTTTLEALRCDRIVEEAMAHGARDPLHIAAMFGLHPDTAQRYTDAVYGAPEQQ